VAAKQRPSSGQALPPRWRQSCGQALPPGGNVKSLIDRTVWSNPLFVVCKALLIGAVCYLFIR
jgi:hypothetical protein